MNIRQSSKYAKYLTLIGWKVGKIGKNYYFLRSVPLLGSVIKIQRPPSAIQEKDLEELRKKHKPFQIIVEPNNTEQLSSLRAAHFKLYAHPYLPSKTIVLYLNKSTKRLFLSLKKDVKYALRKAKKNSVKLKECQDISLFRNAWKKAAPWDRYVTSLHDLKALKTTFGKNCLFLIASDSPDAGAIFLKAGDTAYYWQAFTNKSGRKNLLQYEIVWQGILWAKKRGAKYFDFEGIYDERFPNKKWLGFTHFKKGFGGVEKEYPGCFIKNRWGG